MTRGFAYVDRQLGEESPQFEVVNLLTREEELALAKIIKPGRIAADLIKEDPCKKTKALLAVIDKAVQARDKMVAANLRMGVWCAKCYYPSLRAVGSQSMDFADLIQEANAKLIHAAWLYDWEKGVRFATYAVGIIFRHLIREINTRATTVHIGGGACIYAEQYEEVAEYLHKTLQRKPSDAEVAQRMGISEKIVKTTINNGRRRSFSLQSLVEEDISEGRFIAFSAPVEDFILDDEDDSAARNVKLQDLLENLSPRYRQVIALMYLSEKPATLKEAGRRLKISKERVRQIKNKALEKMREMVGRK